MREPGIGTAGIESLTAEGQRREPDARELSERRRLERRRWLLANLGADAAMLALAAAAAAVGSRALDVPVEHVGWIVAYAAVVVVLLRARGLYRLRLDSGVLDDVARIAQVTSAAAMLVIAVRVLVESDPDVARQTVRLWGFSTIYLAAGRAGVAMAVHRARCRGESLANAVIVGSGEVGRKVARRLRDRPDIGLLPVGFVDDDPPELPVDSVAPVLGTSADVERIVVEHDVRYAVVAFTTARHDVLLEMLRRFHALGVGVLLIPRLFEGVNNRIYVDHLGGLPMLAVRPVDPRGWQFAVKHAFDRVAAAALVLLLLPPLVAIAVAVKLSSPGPVLFRQHRVGRDGRPFEMLKFRTMIGRPEDAGEADRAWAEEVLAARREREVDGEDPAFLAERRTGVGAFLRRHSLDELPQLLNVLRGEMSLVGPRPERVSYALAFETAVHRYGDRHRVKSGITGWAQVHGLRGATSLSDRVEWDNYYIENFSLLLDLKILLMTVVAVFRRAE